MGSRWARDAQEEEGRVRGSPAFSRADVPGGMGGGSSGPCDLFREARHHGRGTVFSSALATALGPGRPGAEPLQCSSSAGRAVA